MDAGSFLDELLYSAQAEQVPFCGNDVSRHAALAQIGSRTERPSHRSAASSK